MGYHGTTQIKGKKYIWLQEVGYVPAKPIKDFKKGDFIAYNYGTAGKVVSIKNATPKYFDVTVELNGKRYTSRVKKDSYKPYFKKKVKK